MNLCLNSNDPPLNSAQLRVNKWSYDSVTNLLAIQPSANFTPGHTYHLQIHILYKNYGRQFAAATPESGDSSSPDAAAAARDAAAFRLLCFGGEYETPFPVLVDADAASYAAPSVFNVTLARPVRSAYVLVFNMDVGRVWSRGDMELVSFPFFSPLLFLFLVSQFKAWRI